MLNGDRYSFDEDKSIEEIRKIYVPNNISILYEERINRINIINIIAIRLVTTTVFLYVLIYHKKKERKNSDVFLLACGLIVLLGIIDLFCRGIEYIHLQKSMYYYPGANYVIWSKIPDFFKFVVWRIKHDWWLTLLCFSGLVCLVFNRLAIKLKRNKYGGIYTMK